MASFTYTARDEKGQSHTGTMSAESATAVMQQLRSEGKYPVSIDHAGPAAQPASSGRRGVKVSRAEVIQISTQLSIMLETGVTLMDALECMAAQATRNPKLRSLLEDLAEVVKGGSDFSTALSRHPRSFPRLYVALIRASEKSGMMARLLQRATTYLRDEQEILRKVRGALTYPGIMFGFALVTTVFLLVFVLPRFTTIYANKGAALPMPTQMLMASSTFLLSHWIAIVGGILTAAIAAWLYVRTSSGQTLWHAIQLNFPLIGAVLRQLHLARGLRMIGTMGSAGVTLTDSVDIAGDLCGNVHFRRLWAGVGEQLHAGRQMSDALTDHPLVPTSIAHMVHSGEKSGKLSYVLEQISTFSEQELKEHIAALTRYIEPAMILVMGLLIGGVALALMLPIFTISKVVAH